MRLYEKPKLPRWLNTTLYVITTPYRIFKKTNNAAANTILKVPATAAKGIRKVQKKTVKAIVKNRKKKRNNANETVEGGRKAKNKKKNKVHKKKRTNKKVSRT